MDLAGQVDIGGLVAELANREPSRTEADVQSRVQTLLLYGGLNLDDPKVKLETPAPGRRRVDVETGLTVIEIKKDLTIGNTRDEAQDQLAGYVRDRTKELGQRYAGILTDGQEWILFHLSQGTHEFTEVSRFEVRSPDDDAERLLVWLEGVLSTAEKLAPTPAEVERRLGAAAPGFGLDLAELSDVYAQVREDSEVRQKRELWARLLAAAFGRHFEDDDKLFIEHTYLVLTAEIIAHAVVGFDLQGGISARDLVSGAEFRKASISGVVEPDFFDWPADSEQGAAFVDGLARRLARFAWGDVEHDVLKVLYESVIDSETRHKLGEYYTPDWLAERMVAEVVDDPLEQRVLDPACGSGTFLFWSLRRYLEAAESAGRSSAEQIAGATEHIFGIDIHPVAVTLARVTYLLAIGEGRMRERDEINVPVYLGDSIQLNPTTSVVTAGGLTIPTSDGLELFARELNFPESVVAEASRFDPLVAELATKANQRNADGKPPAISQVLSNHGVTDESDRKMVEETYNALCHLHDAQRDHIWGYYIRNLARPVEFSRPEHQVDRLVGNPPWLRYNAMTAETQAHFRRLTNDRKLQAPAQVVTSQDLSALFVSRSIELYLSDQGRFAFVMPAAALSRLQYRGFRQADYSSPDASVYVAFGEPWELTEVIPQPFPVPASVVMGSRVDAGDATPLPEKAIWLHANVPSHHHSWEEIADLFSTEAREVIVAGDEFNSPYADLVRQGSNLVPRVLLVVREVSAGPVGLPLSQVAIESARLGSEKAPWKDLESLKGPVEKQFIMPVLIGDSILPFAIRGNIKAVIPWDGEQLLSASDLAIEQHPGLRDWWTEAERLWEKHKSKTTTVDLRGQINYQSKLVNQFPLGEHRVAYTGRGEIVTAARITVSEAVVDHALYWAGFESQEEALYVTGVINTQAIHIRIVEGLSKGLLGGRNIHRAPFLVNWPQFDPAQELHQAIATAAREAEQVAFKADWEGGLSAARTRVRDALGADGIAQRLEELVEQLLKESGALEGETAEAVSEG